MSHESFLSHKHFCFFTNACLQSPSIKMFFILSIFRCNLNIISLNHYSFAQHEICSSRLSRDSCPEFEPLYLSNRLFNQTIRNAKVQLLYTMVNFYFGRSISWYTKP